MQSRTVLYLLSLFVLSDSVGGQGRRRHLLGHRSSRPLRPLQPPVQQPQPRGDDDGFMTDFFSRFPDSPFLTGGREFGRDWSVFPHLSGAKEDFPLRQFAPKESFRHRLLSSTSSSTSSPSSSSSSSGEDKFKFARFRIHSFPELRGHKEDFFSSSSSSSNGNNNSTDSNNDGSITKGADESEVGPFLRNYPTVYRGDFDRRRPPGHLGHVTHANGQVTVDEGTFDSDLPKPAIIELDSSVIEPLSEDLFQTNLPEGHVDIGKELNFDLGDFGEGSKTFHQPRPINLEDEVITPLQIPDLPAKMRPLLRPIPNWNPTSGEVTSSPKFNLESANVPNVGQLLQSFDVNDLLEIEKFKMETGFVPNNPPPLPPPPPLAPRAHRKRQRPSRIHRRVPHLPQRQNRLRTPGSGGGSRRRRPKLRPGKYGRLRGRRHRTPVGAVVTGSTNGSLRGRERGRILSSRRPLRHEHLEEEDTEVRKYRRKHRRREKT